MTTYTFDTPGHLVVRIDDRSGEIDLATHDRPTTEIEITPLEDAATDQVGRTRVEHRETDGRHRIEIEVPSAARNGGLVRRMLAGSTSVRVAVRLPVGADLEVTAASASTRATGRFGAVHIESASGSVGVDDVDGDVEVRTASGSVRVGTVLGSTTIRTASGEVRCGRIAVNSISTASGAVRVDAVTGRLMVKTSSGSVRAGDVTDGCTIQTVSGSQLVERLLAGEAQCDSVSGDVTVRVALGTVVKVDAETVSGHLVSEIDLDEDAGDPDGAARLLNLHARTVSGGVRLERAHT
jgi:DUF4097 and DUF4098 domain-containing protein YvlB